ncbi:recombinase family protein [Capilliphycus salinus ALCB114379]|uniref:recombinase family protein n=1 Tax=Capilliphycus salinus TaxID=2768948 RepID=UPI0039A5FB79
MSVWITGKTRSGKTTRLIEQFWDWSLHLRSDPKQPQRANALVLAANSDNRLDLIDRIWETYPGIPAFDSTTPLGLLQDEVTLFWPLLVRSLDLKAQFPVRLRPETEQELATHLWSQELETGLLARAGVSPDRIVRQTLDLMQLAAMSGQSLEEIPTILTRGFGSSEGSDSLYSCMGQLLVRWRNWCLDRGFLTYGIVTELYWHLLSHPAYQQHLTRRYQMVIADDVDEYPAIMRHLFEFLLESGKMGAFTFNPTGKIRLGLGADPNDLAELQSRCQIEFLDLPSGLAPQLFEPIVNSVIESNIGLSELSYTLSDVPSIQTQSRADLLRHTAQEIIKAVNSQQVLPQEIAVIGPGLDAIARYTLREILSHEGIAVESLQEQRPLLSSPLVRALLTLLGLVYPDLGRLIEREAIAEMLVVLSGLKPQQNTAKPTDELPPPLSRIDPVRAGLLADYCFRPHPQQPTLLEVSAFPRWDRLGYQATTSYNQILQWIDQQREQYQQRLIPSPVSFLDRAIQRFFIPTQSLPSDQLAVLRELMETALHYWEVHARLDRYTATDTSSQTIRSFIELLRRGVVSANPYPVKAVIPHEAVTLATIFQYRANRQSHRWHFWLDIGSPLWLSGGASTLWGAPLFLREWSGDSWTPEDQMNEDRQRLHRILLDLLSRVSDRLYLCHSDLAVNGQEQLGPLLPLVHASTKSIELMPF